MNNNMYLLSIGYPIGGMIINGNYGYQVECEGRLFSFELKSYVIWKMALGGVFTQMSKEIFNEEFNDSNEFNNILKKIIDSKLILAINLEDEEEAFNKIQHLKLFRQGLGIGLKSDNSKYYVKTDKEVELSQVEFTTWMQSNGLKTIKELEDDYASCFGSTNKKTFTEFIQIIFYLYKLGLIYLIR